MSLRLRSLWARVLHGDAAVYSRLEGNEDFPEGLSDLSSHLRMKTPVAARVLYEDGEDLRRDEKFIPMLPPNVLHFYDGETAPREYLEFMTAIAEGKPISGKLLALLISEASL